ncbi:E3 ubiquitin-protein ligase RAD18 isoform X2 [Hyperolius riggenbachi]|uniref:E3 ubiquitin-protein ligase RAD18 isoform X2 n=1 Tax=Hyperolius riggenbachi TaxID=752182 RepID=UPI0035A331BD
MTGSSEGHSQQQPLQALDDLLHCGICFDYFNIAMMIPQCSHNYCSLCIRKFLSYKTQCPTCFVTVTEPELRNNRLLDELVQTFLAARKHLSSRILNSPPTSPQNTSTRNLSATRLQGCTGKKRQEGSSMDMFLVKPSSAMSKRKANAPTQEGLDFYADAKFLSPVDIKQEPDIEEDPAAECSSSQGPSISSPRPFIKVECPVCTVPVPEQYINKHLDSCLGRDEKKESLRSSGQKRRPITKVVYNLLSERDLRKRLKEAGLSTHGTKQQMIRRHQDYVQMYNSQCDALEPKSAAEIIRELEENEKIRSSLEAKQESAMTFKKEQSEEEIDEIHLQYRKKHKSEFQQLLDQVKGRWKNGKSKKENREASSSRADEPSEEGSTIVAEEAERGNDMLQESLEDSVLRAGNAPIVRSSSPVFALSPASRASSSSDILRDIEEAAALEESNSAPDHPKAKAKKRKTSPAKIVIKRQRTPRPKRQRK